MGRFFRGEYREESFALLAAIVLGSTGWGSNFIYPNAELNLMTFWIHKPWEAKYSKPKVLADT